MKKIVYGLLAVMAIVRCDALFAWGQKGHDVIAYIAEQNLNRRAKKTVKEILDGHSMVYYASWMDDLQNSPDWQGKYDATKTWHYANVDEGYTYQTMSKEPKGDVVVATNMFIDGLKSGELSDSLQRDYLKMLIHVMGDLHCPMHAGHRSDSGGNAMRLKWFGAQTSLHGVWDTKLIESAHTWSYKDWQDQLDRCNRKQKKELVAGNVEEWFNATVAISTELYRTAAPEENLSYTYVYRYRPVVERQLLLAGYRLAAVLNDIFG